MKKILIVFMFIFVACIASGQEIKFLNYYLLPKLEAEDVSSLSKFDVLVLDKENIHHNPDLLKKIKVNNKKTKILAYINPMEIFVPMFDDKPFSKKVLSYIKNKGENWWLKSKGEQVVFYEGAKMLNLTPNCPRNSQGVDYSEFFTAVHNKHIFSHDIWDGVFVDNFRTPSWTIKKYNGFDIDGDGKNEQKERIEQEWKEGLFNILTDIKKENPNFEFFANNGNNLLSQFIKARMIENFPADYRGSWKDNVNAAYNVIKNEERLILNANKNSLWLSFASYLMLYPSKTTYFSVGQNDEYRSVYDKMKHIKNEIGGKKDMEIKDDYIISSYTNGEVLYNWDEDTGHIKIKKERGGEKITF